jgi:non-canonical (house-cleaning) NTP pyrophosphatase
MNIVACTTSHVKLQAISALFRPANITTYNTTGAPLPEQPLNCGYLCCQTRINFVKQQKLLEYDYIIAIENVIDTINYLSKGGDSHHYIDECHVMIEDVFGKQYHGISYGIKIHKKYVEQARFRTPLNYNEHGLSVTAGRMIAEENPEIDHANWMVKVYGISRQDQIKSALSECLKQM